VGGVDDAALFVEAMPWQIDPGMRVAARTA
jgi:hypothetical protein